jgi:hypothetical protein
MLRPLADAVPGFALFCLRRRLRVIVTEGAGPSVILAALQAVAPRARTTYVMVGCLWYRAGTPVKRLLQRVRMPVLQRAVTGLPADPERAKLMGAAARRAAAAFTTDETMRRVAELALGYAFPEREWHGG